MYFSTRTKIPTLIDNIEHDVSLTISISMVKVTKIGYHLTVLMLTLALVRFPMTCVAIVITISQTALHFMLLTMGATHVDFTSITCSTE